MANCGNAKTTQIKEISQWLNNEGKVKREKCDRKSINGDNNGLRLYGVEMFRVP